MFCSNCGSKLNEKDSFCQNCGSSVEKKDKDIKNSKDNPVYVYTKKVYPGNGLSIAGMVLGIIAAFFAFVCIITLTSDDFKADMILYAGQVSAYAFGYILIPLVLAVVGLPLSICGKRKHSNGKNITGIILCSMSIITSIIIFIYIISTYN